MISKDIKKWFRVTWVCRKKLSLYMLFCEDAPPFNGIWKHVFKRKNIKHIILRCFTIGVVNCIILEVAGNIW
jgi:hypothetical protein